MESIALCEIIRKEEKVLDAKAPQLYGSATQIS
jgi:hypothetical protein